MIGFTVFVYFQVPETKSKTIEEIAGKFAPSGDKIEVRPRSMNMYSLILLRSNVKITYSEISI